MSEQAKEKKEGALRAKDMPGFVNFNQLFSYLYCMLASTAVLSRPVLGGALYIIGQVIILFSKLILPGDFKRLPKAMRVTGIVLGAVCGFLAFVILFVYPLAVDLPQLWLVFALAFLVMGMNELASRMNRSLYKKGVSRERRLLRVAEMMVLLTGIMAIILFFSQSKETAWYLLGGFALCCVFRFHTLRKEDPRELKGDDAVWSLLKEDHKLTQVNAYKVFRMVMMIVITALQITMIIMFTFIGTTADSLFSSLLISLVCAILARWVTVGLLSHTILFKKLEPGTTLIIGLVLWLLSLVSFSVHTISGALGFSYAALALCTVGVTMAGTAVETLEKDMRDVVHFALGVPQDNALLRTHIALSEYAALIGGMIALVGLALITLLSETRGTYDQLTLTFQPLLLLPALALVAVAIPVAFRVPIDRRIVEKTRTFLRLKETGEINIPLQKQLEDMVVKVHRRRYGIKLIIIILRPFFYSRVIGADKVSLPQDTSVIFTCNHGELWGPIVTNLFIPFSFRPWVIDEIAVPESSSTYLYKNTIKRQKWIPEKLKWPVTRLVSVVLQWIMRSLDSIPVYRDNPRALVNTFRETAAAMEAGDNILIFPENPNDAGQAQAGYLREGVGEFFNGFAMTAQIYYQRTGKRALFYPIFADKAKHTLTFGEPTQYDPDNKGDEKQRIADHLRNEMLRMAGLPYQEKRT
ncbi:MAG: lysophospholipid acyltransferase family protein [Bacillota bacterium]|nr:lysophospholipid acyltransferase family protein [Bacillota bacterium]